MISGNLTLIDNNKKYYLSPGDKVDLMANSFHKFIDNFQPLKDMCNMFTQKLN